MKNETFLSFGLIIIFVVISAIRPYKETLSFGLIIQFEKFYKIVILVQGMLVSKHPLRGGTFM